MVFVVAEIGVNWDGDFELAEAMMKDARRAGCNAVKFQAYHVNVVKNHPERDRLMKTSITRGNVEIINELAKSADIEWFCTPMYPEAVDFLEPFIKRFKIREVDGRSLLENRSSELLDRVLKTNKELFVSCQTTPRGSKYFNHSQIKWLYCVPKYPCSLSDLDFRSIKDFDGFSNHCPYLIAPLTAVILGAEILEIHITSDRTKNFIDNNVSLDYVELKDLIQMIHLSKQIIT